MDKKILNREIKKVHFIGIGGAGMCGLALHLLAKGIGVSGSDACLSETTEHLKSMGAEVFYKHTAKNVKGADMVVYSSAINDDNPELLQAKKQKIPTLKRSQLLGEFIKQFKKSVAISGSHGKTTATAMIANVLKEASLSPSVFLGGESVDFGNYLSGDDNLVVLEACEYKRNFLDLNPNIAVVLNVDHDHPDSYKTIDEQFFAFSEFIKNKIAVVNADDEHASKLFNSACVSFGIQNVATYTAKKVKAKNGKYSFTACVYGSPLGKINLSVLGKHNVYNALATIAVAHLLGVPFSAVKKGLETFKGVKRRLEFLGTRDKCNFYADYAHHPNEIIATLKCFFEAYGEAGVVFQPHTYSRTKALMEDFVGALKGVSDCVIYKTYSAREKVDENASAKALYENLISKSANNLVYAKSVEELENAVQNLSKKYKNILFLGAGDIYQIAKSFI
ncbi:MAG: UDP-N-acetylmuramate--L-alanine ligase [Clostridiales bacterium]|nr:UDP-N-acetylmuramate--L-alanine ligase [Clostridiales bacterium]